MCLPRIKSIFKSVNDIKKIISYLLNLYINLYIYLDIYRIPEIAHFHLL